MRADARFLAAFLALFSLLGLGCPKVEDPEDQGPFYDPWTVMPSEALAERRGLQTLRGIVHNHSPYSHDACDGDPRLENGTRNEQCFFDVRNGMCDSGQDFVFLTDHGDLFASYEYPEVLLYAEGDSLIEHDGQLTANRVHCVDNRQVIVAAGTETGMMPIGLEHHVGDTPAEREANYGEISEAAVRRFQAAGGLVFLQHTEGWSNEEIMTLPIDGIECYNLHQNMMDRMGDVVSMVLEMVNYPDDVPVPELSLIAVFEESQADLTRWAHAVATRRLPAVVATDAHRNVFNDETYDGERLDSFRRMMRWFSNYVRVPAEQVVDDRVLKNAIAEGRFYSAFDYLGYAVDFDFFADASGEKFEMGAAVPSDQGVSLIVRQPSLYRQDPKAPAPVITTLILKAVGDDWELIAENQGDLEIDVTAGVYRAEVRIVPKHLAPWLGRDPQRFIRDLPWVYSNPIYVGRDQ